MGVLFIILLKDTLFNRIINVPIRNLHKTSYLPLKRDNVHIIASSLADVKVHYTIYMQEDKT